MNSESGTPALVLIAEKGTEDVGVFPLPGRPGVLSKSLDTDVAIDNPYVSSEHFS